MFTKPGSSRPSLWLIFSLAILMLTTILSCSSQSGRTNPGKTVTATQASPTPTSYRVRGRIGSGANPLTGTPATNPTEVAVSTIEEPTDTPVPTEPGPPTDTPLPTQTFTITPRPTRTPTPTITPTPGPTACPRTYCVAKATCIPSTNTRAIGTVYENGVPKNDVRVRVSYADGGPPIVTDFISGHDPLNPQNLDPAHPGYYQIGIHEGSAFDGNWWVFLIDDKGHEISVGRYFKTTDVTTSDSCQVGVTDFFK